MEKRSKRLWRVAATIGIMMLSAALVSCGGTTRKKKYRFGGCEVTAAASAPSRLIASR
ncbi:MAG: hypothetical protein ACI35Q_04965 [Marinilabiliaceae bacterium]